MSYHLFWMGGDNVSISEALGFVTGLWCVFLTVKAHLWNFPVGIVNSFFFVLLFFNARLWADGGLNILYIALGFYGWWLWVYGGENRSRLLITKASQTTMSYLVVFVVLATWGLTLLLGAVNDVAPFWDALTTALSLAATWLLNFKRLQNWYFWILADIVYVPLYFVKHLDLTGIVYIAFLGLATSGLFVWRKLYKAQEGVAFANA